MIGQTISHYRILEKLGGGGMGVVYKAEDTTLKRTVALKFLPPALTLDPEAQERFVHEARAASALDHSNICTIHEIGHTDDGRMFIVMACYDGQTLKKVIEQGSLDIDLALDTGIQIAEGLVHAHDAGIVHRDIKPANVFVTSHNEVKILDFGLAKLAGQTMMTKTGSTLGTAAYMSPEQARGETVDHRTDIWSLGVVLYEMLTGHLPFKRDYEQALIYAILNEDPTPIRQSRPDVPEVVEQIVARAMGKNLEDRYQRVADLLADLKIARGKKESGGTLAAAAAMQKRGRKRLLRRVAATCAVALVLAVFFFIVRPMISDEAIASNPKTILVISFENQTGDKGLDNLRNSIPSLLITSLEQSKFFQVITPERFYDILKQMGKKRVDYIDRDLGQEICRREHVDAMVVGSYTRAGDLYVTDLKVLDAGTLQPIGKSVRTKGQGVESILNTQIDELAKEISRGLGVSRLGAGKTLKPVTEITTQSMEAYQLYQRGFEEKEKYYLPDARRCFELAVQKDSLFLSAWIELTDVCSWLGDERAAQAAWEKACSLANRGTQKEQFQVALSDTTFRARLMGSSHVGDLEFARQVKQKFPQEKQLQLLAGARLLGEGKIDESIEAFTRALELDPEYKEALNWLAYRYSEKGDVAKAVALMKRYQTLSPGDANPFDSMGETYLNHGMFDEAIPCFEMAHSLKSDWNVSAKSLASCYYLKEDYANAFRWCDSAAARSSTRGVPQIAGALWRRAYYLFWLGRLAEAQSVLRKIDALYAGSSGVYRQNRGYLEAWIAFERGTLAQSRSYLETWLNEELPGDVPLLSEMSAQFSLGIIDLKQGRLDSVRLRLSRMEALRARIGEADSAFPGKQTVETFNRGSDILHSELFLAEGRPLDAVAAAPKRTNHDLSSRPMPRGFFSGLHNAPSVPPIPVMVDVLPRAYLAAGMIDSAIAAYERAVDPKIDPICPIFPRYHYRLALLYERKGIKAKAVAEYKKFLEIWGKADPIYKEPADARARLARLKRSG